MKWIYDDGIIKWENNTEISYPNSQQIFSCNDESAPFFFSKMLALNISLSFICDNGTILFMAYAQKGKTLYEVKKNNGVFLDYIVIDSTCYYLDSSITLVNSLLESENINVTEPLTFFEYINVSRFLKNSEISFNDQVTEKEREIKDDESAGEYKGFTGKLFPYQESGVKWLNFMTDGKCGCILADSMGLGKTLQIILTLGHAKDNNSEFHSLIIAPLSILENWKREMSKFYPSLKCHVNYGDTNLTYYREMMEYDVIVTSYSSLQTNFSTYEMIKWNIVVLDEAQNIKNPDAKRTKTIKELNRDVGIAVSGTPFENHVTDIWSITDFVIPGYLGTLNEFNSRYDDDMCSANQIERLISPIMIRRKVEDVAKDLPERVDIPQPLTMSMEEAKYYDAELKSFEELKTVKLDKIQHLRMFCTHPSIYEDSYRLADPAAISQKYARCCEIIEEIVENGEKAVVFTSFNSMIDLLVSDLHKRFNVPVDFINGDTEAAERQNKIDRFSDISGSSLLVLNPKATGVGLNITAANHVIHYNLEWNPAVEDQASARVYRRGQNRTVFVHRLFYVNTIEEVINEKIERKRLLSGTAIIGNEGELNDTDLARALSLSPVNMDGGKMI